MSQRLYIVTDDHGNCERSYDEDIVIDQREVESPEGHAAELWSRDNSWLDFPTSAIVTCPDGTVTRWTVTVKSQPVFTATRST